jgi:putative oxidoreductase
MARDSGTSGSRTAGPLGKLRALEDRLVGALAPFLLLLLRVVFGYGMLRAGWGKLTHLEQTTGFFASLDIPAPAVNAIVVAGLEFGGGILLLLGLLTRTAAGVLTPVMLVALLTAHRGEVSQFFSNPGAAIAAAPMPFLVALIALALSGPGPISLDRLISGRQKHTK